MSSVPHTPPGVKSTPALRPPNSSAHSSGGAPRTPASSYRPAKRSLVRLWTAPSNDIGSTRALLELGRQAAQNEATLAPASWRPQGAWGSGLRYSDESLLKLQPLLYWLVLQPRATWMQLQHLPVNGGGGGQGQLVDLVSALSQGGVEQLDLDAPVTDGPGGATVLAVDGDDGSRARGYAPQRTSLVSRRCRMLHAGALPHRYMGCAASLHELCRIAT